MSRRQSRAVDHAKASFYADPYARGISFVMERLSLLKRITFGERVAEDETAALGKYFVETDQWDRIFNGAIDIVRGDKGSGKSAIYSLLVVKSDDLFDKRILLTTAERPRGATVFSDLVADPPTSEHEFIGLWKLYIVTIIAQKLKEFDLGGAEYKKLIGILEDQKLLEPDSDMSRIFKAVREYMSHWSKPRVIEGSVAIDPTTMVPTVLGKITLGEPTANDRVRGFISVDKLADLANTTLADADYQIWVLLDRLDVAFVESHDLEPD
jgi:hypothetical protein